MGAVWAEQVIEGSLGGRIWQLGEIQVDYLSESVALGFDFFEGGEGGRSDPAHAEAEVADVAIEADGGEAEGVGIGGDGLDDLEVGFKLLPGWLVEPDLGLLHQNHAPAGAFLGSDQADGAFVGSTELLPLSNFLLKNQLEMAGEDAIEGVVGMDVEGEAVKGDAVAFEVWLVDILEFTGGDEAVGAGDIAFALA